METIQRSAIRNLDTGKIIDDCIPDNMPDRILNRRIPLNIDIRIELTLREADRRYRVRGPADGVCQGGRST